MRIGIDARLWGEEKNRGLGRYAKELVLNLEKVASPDDHFFIFLTKENFNDYQPSVPNFQKILWDVRWYTLREQIDFRPLLRVAAPSPHPTLSRGERGGGRNLDLVHFPHWNVPYFFNQPFIVTIHDLILLESNRQRQATTLGKMRYALKFAGFKLILQHALKKAKKIIAVSETTKKDIIKYFPQTADKIEVIYQGIPEIKPTHQSDWSDQSDWCKSKGINRPYLLYVGSAYPHKNLEFLIKTFLEFNQENDHQYQLVLVGQEDFFYRRLKEKITHLRHSDRSDPRERSGGISHAGLSRDINLNNGVRSLDSARDDNSSVVFLGQANNDELGALYQNAEFLINPSLMEGFGFPPLEAAALGTPSLVSDIPIFHEILGQAALYFDPKNAESLKNTLNQALKHNPWQTNLKKNAIILPREYSWLETAKQTLSFYHYAVRKQK